MATSFSRIGSANTYDNALHNLQMRQSTLSNLQENLSSGKKVVRASDDPTGAAQAERAMTRITRIQTDQRALEAQRNAIASAESTLGDVSQTLQNFRELAASAGNGTQTAQDRKTIAAQLMGLRDQVLALSNRKDTNGLPLFSGLGSALAPFVGPQALPTDYTFNGLPGQSSSTDVAIPFTLDGDSAFMHQPARDGVYNVSVAAVAPSHQMQTSNIAVTNASAVTGASYAIAITAVDTTTVPGTTTVSYNVTATPPGTVTAQTAPGYPTGQPANIAVAGMAGLSLSIKGAPAVGDTLSISPSPSLFSVLDNAIRDIGTAADSNAAIQAVNQALNNIDIGMSRVSAVRGLAGDLLNRADRITTTQEKRSIQLEADRSRAEDLDMTKGISDFQQQQTAYQAALQSYAQVQKLSLFNYIG